jgi:hypothetical protein
MAQFVVKKWQAGKEPLDQEGTQVYIHARGAGLIAWLLSLAGIDPVVTLRVTPDYLVIEEGSLRGSLRAVIPLSKISSSDHGYVKPWQEALAITIMLLPVFGVGLLIGPLYYFLNKTLSIGFTEDSGRYRHISFKRSVIEGVKIDEHQAAEVTAIIQHLVNQRT